MKVSIKAFSALFLLLPCICAAGDYSYTPATDLVCVNKFVQTSKPYHRLDADRYPGMTENEKLKCAFPTGLAFSFSSDATTVGVRAAMGRSSDGDISAANNMRGFDLYVFKDGQWLWAGGKALSRDCKDPEVLVLAKGLFEGRKHFLLYCPMVAELKSLDVFVPCGALVEAAPSPFRGRVALWGSSLTQGSGCSRSGESYPAQLTRLTGVNFINLGFSGRCMLQQYFADALLEGDVDAYVFDAFSNPSARQIRERLFPFIERFQKEKPGVPLIFIRTIFREKRLTQPGADAVESEKMAVADSLMRIACKKYNDVYWITSSTAAGKYRECTTDGTHPTDHGYTLLAESIEKPLKRILRKYIHDQ